MAQEKQFENKLKSFLDEQGAWYIKYWAGSQFTKSGIPDILACINGHFVAVEVKAQNGKPSELQLHTISKIREAGGFAVIVYPSGFEKFKDLICKLKMDWYSEEMEVIIK